MSTLVSFVLSISVALALNGCRARSPDEMLMTDIEQQLKMPVGAKQIANYDRYYARQDPDKVIGTFVGAGQGGERKWVKSIDQLPAINDGGCGIVNLIYDLKTKKVTTFCNGLA